MNAVTRYLSEIGTSGGHSKTKAKAAASRINGRLGGRPKLKWLRKKVRKASSRDKN